MLFSYLTFCVILLNDIINNGEAAVYCLACLEEWQERISLIDCEGDISGFEKFVYCRKENNGISWAKLYEIWVVGGLGSDEIIFVLLIFVGLEMDC